MVKLLVAAAMLWPVLLGAAVWQRTTGPAAAWTVVPYLIGSQVCHQRPDRSFHTDGVRWPVCGRCSGLYLAAPVGMLVALAGARRRAGRPAVTLAVAAVPTMVTVVLEWTGLAPMSNLARALSALPLGATVAYWLVRAARSRPTSIK
jgi:uncharacterized membrane protein